MVPDNSVVIGPESDGPMHESPLAPDRRPRGSAAPLTRKERRRRWRLLIILLLLLALLGYGTYYFLQNRRLPLADIGQPEIVEPPRYLYSITGQGANELQIPLGVAVGEDGRVYVVDFGRRRISIFTNNGRFIKAFDEIAGGEKLGNPVQLTVTSKELWVTDRRLRTIEIFDLEGKHLRTFDPEEAALEDWSPMSVTFGDDGRFWVTDVGNTKQHRVHYFSADGSRTVSVGRTFQAKALEEEPGGFFYPTGVAVSDDYRVYVSDGNNRRVQEFDDKGEFKAFVDTSGVPRGIAIDEEDRIYVVDAIAHSVDIYDLAGTRITQFGGRGLGEGQFNYPNYVALDARGRIYVSDRENNQVQVWGWPIAEPPTITPPSSPWGWAACLLPLLLLPLLLLRKKRVIVTPDLVEALVAMEEIGAVADKKRLRLVAPTEDAPLYKDRIEEGVNLGDLIFIEDYSEADARALAEKYELADREAMLLSMAERARALATQDVELRRLATLAEVKSVDVEEFIDQFVRPRK